MSKKDAVIKNLEEQIELLQEELHDLDLEYNALHSDYIRAMNRQHTYVSITEPEAPSLVSRLKAKLFRYERYWTFSFELNPFQWFGKPRYYRFDHKKYVSETREGDASFGPWSVNWYRDIKR